MLGHLEGKGYVRHRRDGRRFLYAPTLPLSEARRGVVRHVIDTFFHGSAEGLVTMLLRADELAVPAGDRQRLLDLIDELAWEDEP